MENGPTEFRSVFDHPPDDERLKLREENRQKFLTWIKATLQPGKDFGPLHIKRRSDCDLGYDCNPKDRPYHWSKPSLFKPGAEKILDYFALIPHWPSLEAYEQKALTGDPFDKIILECRAIDDQGISYGQGIGGRDATADEGDINKSLKMAKKSSLVDCAITVGKLSEHFTQDIEDMNLEGFKDKHKTGQESEPEFDRNAVVGWGKKAPKVKWCEVELDYLVWMVQNARNKRIKRFAALEIEAREKAGNGEPSANSKPQGEGIKVPELQMFLKELSPDKIASLVFDRYDVQSVEELDREKQLNLLAYFQAERPVRMLIVPLGGKEPFAKTFAAHFPGSSYAMMSPDDFNPFREILAAQVRIKKAAEIVENGAMIVAGWQRQKGTTLHEAGIEDLRDLEQALNGQADIPFK